MLPLFYLGNISYYKALLSQDSLVFDQHEHFIKQSYRSRCEIFSSQGKLALSIPVHRKNHMPYKEVKIDYSCKWVKEHIQAIKSAYASSPYFIDYAEGLFTILEKEHGYLKDLNLATTEHLLQQIQIQAPLRFSDAFEPYHEDDLRLTLSPKLELETQFPVYLQVFDQEHGFIPNLSIIDLLFNEGPMSRSYLDALN